MIRTSNKMLNQLIHYGYFKRQQQAGSRSNDSKHYQHKYTLLNIARIDTMGRDIYLNYFYRIFNYNYTKLWREHKKMQRQKQLKPKQQDFSFFFQSFIKLTAAMYMMQPISKRVTQVVNNFVNDLVGISKRQPMNTQETSFMDEILELEKCKEIIMNMVDSQFNPVNKDENFRNLEKERNFEKENRDEKLGTKIEQKLIQIKKEFRQKFEQITQSQILPMVKKINKLSQIKPIYLSEEQLTHLLMDNFIKITNIDSFQQHAKKQFLKSFVTINKHYITIQIPDILQTFRENGSQKYSNQIKMPRYSQEIQPVLMKLIDFIPLLHKLNSNKHNFPSLITPFIESLILFFSDYHRKTDHVYPKTKSTDIYYDQKKLKIIVSYHPLIYEAIGLNEMTKSLELRIATDPTPSFDFEACYLQFSESNKWKLREKYFISRPVNEESDEVNNRVEKEKEELRDLEERIHVWRLINFLYFLSTNSRLTNALYPEYYAKIQKSPNCPERFRSPSSSHSPKPFHLEMYKKIIEEIYKEIAYMPEILIALIPSVLDHLPDMRLAHGVGRGAEINFESQVQTQQPQRRVDARQSRVEGVEGGNIWAININHAQVKFNFKLSELRELMGVHKEDDSLFEGLKLISIKSQFYHRFVLIREINNLLTHKKIFRKFINAMKYLVISFSILIERLHLWTTIRTHSSPIIHERANPNLNRDIEEEFSKDFKNTILQQEFNRRKLNLQSCTSKLAEYKTRKDPNSQFLKNNPAYLECIEKTIRDMKTIGREEDIQEALLNDAKIDWDSQKEVEGSSALALSEEEKSSLQAVKYLRLRKAFLQELSVMANKLGNNPAHYDEFTKRIVENKQLSRKEKDQLLKFKEDRKYEELMSRLDKNEEEGVRELVASIEGVLGAAIEKLKKPESEEYPLIANFKDVWDRRILFQVRRAHEEAHGKLKMFSMKEVEGQVEQLEVFHKRSDFKENAGEKICLFYNTKLLALLKMYLAINEDNWKKYERLYQSIVPGGAEANSRSLLEKIELLGNDELELLIMKMKLIIKTIDNDSTRS